MIRVHDGDTLTARCDRGPLKIRIANIDAPELHQESGAAAKRALEALVRDRRVRVDSVAVDRYERVVARLSIESSDLGLSLVAQGHAWCGLRPTANCKRAQSAAKEARLGLWTTPDPIPPWQWRREHPRRH